MTLPLPRRISNSESSGKYGIRLLIDCKSFCAASLKFREVELPRFGRGNGDQNLGLGSEKGS